MDKDQRLDPSVERRSARRFPIQQDAVYKIQDHRLVAPGNGTGRTVDISSDGVLFETEQHLCSGKRVELTMNWPAELEGGCALKFVACGRVVRSEDNQAAMHIEHYVFRTRRTKELPAMPEKPARNPVPYY